MQQKYEMAHKNVTLDKTILQEKTLETHAFGSTKKIFKTLLVSFRE